MDPPYWDSLTGVFSQGIWLKNNNFDFIGLHHQPGWWEGGPRNHLFMILAPVIGLLYRLLTPKLVFLFCHAFTFFSSALTLTISFKILRTKLSNLHALIWVAAAGFNPIWSGQTAAIYLEVPLVLCICSSLFFLLHKKYIASSFLCLLAYFVKNSAMLFGLSYLVLVVFLAILHCFNKTKSFDKKIFVVAFPFFLMFALNLVDQYKMGVFWDVFGYLKYFYVKAPFLYPDYSVLLPLSIIVFFSSFFFKKNFWIFGSHEVPSIFLYALIIYISGFWLSFIMNTIPLPRYLVMILFPLTWGVGFFTCGP